MCWHTKMANPELSPKKGIATLISKNKSHLLHVVLSKTYSYHVDSANIQACLTENQKKG